MVEPGYQLLVRTLGELGIDMVFGVPGSEAVELFEAFRLAGIRTITSTSEREAGFMAVGHFCASGRPAAICTIGGPGFTNALTGLAEARDDSVPLIHILVLRDQPEDKEFGLHAMDHRAIAAPIVKAYHVVDRASALQATLNNAHLDAVSGEPGPVVIGIRRSVLLAGAQRQRGSHEKEQPEPDTAEVIDRLQRADRPVLLVGQGSIEGAVHVRRLAEHLTCPVLPTASARGILADAHPLCFFNSYGQDSPGTALGGLLEESDLILAVGAKFTHNGTHGFTLDLPQEKLVHVDASPHVTGVNYPASELVVADAPQYLRRLADQVTKGPARQMWPTERLEQLKEWLEIERREWTRPDQRIKTPAGRSPSDIFSALRAALPDSARLVCDSGRHQFLVRAHFEVRAPRSLLFPADFQSMGYGLPAAIGAKAAEPGSTVVAVVGDGGFAMTAMELSTAVREALAVKVMVLANEALGLVREAQIRKRGREHAVRVLNPDFETLAGSFGVAFARWDDLDAGTLRSFLAEDAPGLIEVRLRGSRDPSMTRWMGRARAVTERTLGPDLSEKLKKGLSGI